jgi:ABC-2 type transport system ATP-binding protein
MSSEIGSIELVGVNKWFEPYRRSNLTRAIPGRIGEVDVVPGTGTMALDSIDLVIPPGQSVGIIGDNGAGKSTLLRVLAGIHRPTAGRVAARGRLAAIIELGVGFHPDLTGWENIRLAAALRGIPAAQTQRFIDEVVEFSGLTSALDQPLKQYSTGMAARLGFSVATHGQADILAIDEAIAVGDREFQVRCIERVRMLQEQGTTVLFVSHDLWLVTQLCERALVLDHGRVVDDGDPEVVVPRYLISIGQLRPAEGAEAPVGGATVEELRVLTPTLGTGDRLEFEASVGLPEDRTGIELEVTLTFPPFGPWAASRVPLPPEADGQATLRIVTDEIEAVGRGVCGVSAALVAGPEVLDRASASFDLGGEERRKPFLRVPIEHRWVAAGPKAPAAPIKPMGLDATAIRILGLTKRFDDIDRRRIRRALPFPLEPNGTIALDDVNFEVAPGDFIGLIGPNGAGKSTLLKVIAGITRGQEGSVEVTGRLVSMIELGVGFHPDLTADENLLLGGQLLGLDGDQLEAIYDDVVDFAGVRHAMAEPIKHFSTGMVARLGFALASHVPSDILLVDEMLSVGDAEFRDRALQRMEELNGKGTTIVLVSHDLRVIAEVCERAIVLADGRVIDSGPADEVVDRFGGTDLAQADPYGHHDRHAEGSTTVSTMALSPRSVHREGTVTVTARLETSTPVTGARVDLCIAEPFTPGWARSGGSNEVYDRSLAAESISTGDDLFSEAGRWDLTATIGCRSLRPGVLDVVVLVVDEFSGEIISEARRPLRVRGRAGDHVGVYVDMSVTVVA